MKSELSLPNRTRNRVRFVVSGILFAAASAFTQPPDPLWPYTYASPYNDDAQSIASVSDGGFVVGGKTWDPDSGYHALLIRLDANGHEQWTQTYPFWGRINAIASFTDDGWALASGEAVFCRMKIIRTDSLGNVQWQRCIYHPDMEEAVGIAATLDGGVVAVSEGGWGAAPDIFLVRLSAGGDSLWAHSYGGPAEDHGGAVLLREDGGFFVTGSRNHQAWVFITDSLGEMLWDSTFGDPTLTERLWAACETPSGDYAVAGIWQANGSGAYHPFAACVTPYGDTLWTRYFPYLGQGSFHSVAVLPDGNIVLGGSNSETYDLGYLVVLLTAIGDTVWTTRYNTPLEDAGRALCLTPDSGFAITGYQHPDMVDQNDIWVIRSESLYLQSSDETFTPLNISIVNAYPNPFNSVTSIRFVTNSSGIVDLGIYDVTGRFVRNLLAGFYPAGEHQTLFDAQGLASGIYFAKLTTPSHELSQKFLLLR